jgi:predicted RNA-binding Zn-ribbon protein involved in translation (DUF1610 family)
MTDRVILADCCEDWILQWGGFYPRGGAFACPECGTEWTKTRDASFRRATDHREFERRERRGPSEGAGFPYLAAADGMEPIVERCCAKILLTHGERMREGAFVCPVCSTRWEKRTERLHGLRVPVFEREGLAESLTIQPGRTRPFLVGVSEYSPPRD